MIWQDVVKYAGTGSISLFLILTLILNLSGMTYTVPNDQYCNDCYDMIQVNSTYWEIKVEHAGIDKDIVYKKMTRSRTLWVNLDRISELLPTNPKVFVEIMKPTISKYSTVKHPEYGYLRPLKDGDVLIYRKNKYHPNGDRIIIHGITNGQTVKWGLELDSWLSEEFSFDPIWYGTTPSTFSDSWGSLISPANRTRTLDDRSIEFTFNASAGGIHNTSNLEQHVVGNWWFERNSEDESGNGNDGTWVNADGDENVTGIIGYGYEFDGWNDYIDMGDIGNLSDTDLSIGFWMKINGWGSGNKAVLWQERGPVYLVFLYTSGESVRYGGGTIATIGTPGLDEWHYYFVSYVNDTTNATVYYDGVYANSIIDDYDGDGTFLIGRSDGGGGDYPNATIDEVIIFNRTLSSGEISEMYNQTLYGEPRTIENCSLLLDIDDAGWQVNRTYDSEVAHNTSGLEDYVVGNWWFERDSTDESGNANHGVISGGVTNGTGIVGYAYEFDGVDDYINVGSDTSLNMSADENFAVSVWFKTADSVSFDSLVSKITDHFKLLLQVTGRIRFGIGNMTVGSGFCQIDTDNEYDDMLWHHVVGTYDSTNAYIYVDGVEVKSISCSISGSRAGIQDILIGQRATGGLNFNGTIDEVLIFNRSLSSGEISEMYNLTNDRVNFEGYYTTFDDIDFAYDQHDIDWKVQCYDDLDIPWNSSEFLLELSARTTMSKPNIGAHAFYDPNYVVGSWRFERVEGTNVVDTTGINNGTISGGVKWCPDEGDSQKWNCSGRVGKGVLFDRDENDYIEIPNDESLQFGESDFTVSAWIIDDLSGITRYFYAKGLDAVGEHSLMIGIGVTNKFKAYMDGSTFGGWSWGAEAVIDDTNWHHVVFVRTGNFSYGYIDGVLIGTDGPYWIRNVSNARPAYIGRREESAYSAWNNSIDEVTIWNRSLSATEIKQLYYSSAVSYNSTYTINDISASNNNTGDLDNDTIKYIYDWYVNNNSMAVLNMPFEAVNNGSEMNFSKDYSDNENHGTTNFNSDVYYGAVNDSSGWNRTGGVDGFGAYEFDGDGDYVNISDDDSLDFGDGDFSLSLWVKANGQVDNSYMIGKGGAPGWRLFWDPDGTWLRLYVNDGGTDCNLQKQGNIEDGAWHHYVAVWNADSSTVGTTLYEDGISLGFGCDASALNSISNSISVMIGSSQGGTSNFNGTIDEVLIFNRSLSSDQILALYRNQTQTIKSSETQKGQSWKAEVTANDGYSDSIPYNTSEIVIQDGCSSAGQLISPSSNAVVDCSDNCIWTNKQYIKNLYFKGTGEIRVSGEIMALLTQSKIVISSGCKLKLASGGKIF